MKLSMNNGHAAHGRKEVQRHRHAAGVATLLLIPTYFKMCQCGQALYNTYMDRHYWTAKVQILSPQFGLNFWSLELGIRLEILTQICQYG